MRKLLSIALIAMTCFATSARCEYKTGDFFRDCTMAVRSASGETNVTTASLPNILHCLGFVEAAAISARKMHELYGFAFPSLTRSILNSDKKVAERYISAIMLSGADLCIPDGTTVQVLTMLVVKHLNANPKDLSASPATVANVAWADAYPCEIPP
jgi:hypothetical protein